MKSRNAYGYASFQLHFEGLTMKSRNEYGYASFIKTKNWRPTKIMIASIVNIPYTLKTNSKVMFLKMN